MTYNICLLIRLFVPKMLHLYFTWCIQVDNRVSLKSWRGALNSNLQTQMLLKSLRQFRTNISHKLGNWLISVKQLHNRRMLFRKNGRMNITQIKAKRINEMNSILKLWSNSTYSQSVCGLEQSASRSSLFIPELIGQMLNESEANWASEPF
jgi:hypothetical protein